MLLHYQVTLGYKFFFLNHLYFNSYLTITGSLKSFEKNMDDLGKKKSVDAEVKHLFIYRD